jgi:hypothetical protein
VTDSEGISPVYPTSGLLQRFLSSVILGTLPF